MSIKNKLIKLSVVLIFIVLSGIAYSTTILFPGFNIYSEMNYLGQVSTSYSIDLMVDTGLKYGVKVGIGIKNYNITSLESNILLLNSVNIEIQPFNLFHLNFFLGKNCTIGEAGFGYEGFQFHQHQGLEYIGFHTISGTGIEFYRSFWDNLFEPHIYVYGADKNGTNYFNIDTLFIFRTDRFHIEAYFGINNSTNYIDTNSNTTNYLAKHFGVAFKTKLGKVDFSLGLYFPDSMLLGFNSLDDIYINVSEHLLTGWFEQTISLFSHPSIYNGVLDCNKGELLPDFDIYLALGIKIKNLGFGIENTLITASPTSYSTTNTNSSTDIIAASDRVGTYVYFNMNSLKYKIGFFYSFGLAYTASDQLNPHSPAGTFGGYINISGKF